MNFHRTTPSSRRLMTSKTRFLGDETADVYAQWHFSQPTSTSSALLGHLKPYRGATGQSFPP
jgi:hypothetical protein